MSPVTVDFATDWAVFGGLFTGATEPRPDGARIAPGDTPQEFTLHPTAAAGPRTPAEAVAEAVRVGRVVSAAGADAGAALRADLVSAGGPLTAEEDAAVALVAAYLSGFVGGVNAAAEAPPAAPKKRGGSDLIAFTVPPVVAYEQAVADAATARGNFTLTDGNRRLYHTRGKAGYMVAVDYADPVASVDEALREIGERAGLEAVFTVAAACYHALEHEGEAVHADDALLDIGWARDRDGIRETRDEAAARVARLYLLLNGWSVVGDSWGKFTDKDGRAIDVSSDGPLFTTTILRDPQGTLLEPSAPVGFVWRRGDFLARVAEHPHVLATFGTYRELAHMPRKRPADAWAVSIGLALVQRWRELARYARVTTPGEKNLPAVRVPKMTRRYLLTQYPPYPDPVDVLADKANGARNAKAYWTQALARLKHAGVIDADVQRRLAGEPAKLPRIGWGEAWLGEALDGRPPEGYKAEFLSLAERAETHEKKKRRRRRPPTRRGTQ